MASMVQPLRRRMRRLIAAAIPIALLAMPAPSAAASHVRLEIHDVFVDPYLSELCGTPVMIAIDASLNISLVYRDGLLVREIDPSGNGTTTVSAPERGTSFSYPFNNVIIDYGSGAVLGSPVTLAFTGLIGDVPGQIAADAGRGVLSGYVSGPGENGLPEIEITDFVSFRGRITDDPRVIETATCAALA